MSGVKPDVIQKLEELEAYERAGREARQAVYEAFAELWLRQLADSLEMTYEEWVARNGGSFTVVLPDTGVDTAKSLK